MRQLDFAAFSLGEDLGVPYPMVSSWTGVEGDEGGPAAESPVWAIGALQRELTWYASLRQPRRGAGDAERLPALSRGVVEAIERAMAEAHAVGVAYLTHRHLILSLLQDPTNRACQILVGAGLDREAWIAALRAHDSIRWDAPLPGTLGEMLKGSYANWLVRLSLEWPLRIVGPIMGFRARGLVVASVVSDGMRLAARLEHARATSAHVLCALVDADQQIERSEGGDLPPDIAAHYNAGVVMRRVVTLSSLIVTTAELPDEAEVAFPKRGTYAGGLTRKYWSESSDKACRDAEELAQSLGHRDVGTTHLLVGCLVDSEGPAFRLLTTLDADPATTRDEAMRILARAN